jgi:hypothetical protein
MIQRLLISLALVAATIALVPQVARAADLPSCKNGDPVVWVNTSSHVYHLPGDPYYGKTKAGAYECESAAVASGAHASGSKHATTTSAASPAPVMSPTPKPKKKHHQAVASPSPSTTP